MLHKRIWDFTFAEFKTTFELQRFFIPYAQLYVLWDLKNVQR